MWRAIFTSIAARSAKRLLGGQGQDVKKAFASSSSTLTPSSKQQVLWQKQCRGYHQRPHPLLGEKAGDADAAAAALKAADDNAQRFLLAATGGTLAFAAYVAFGKGKHDASDHGKKSADGHKASGSSQGEKGNEEAAPPVDAGQKGDEGEPEVAEEGEEKGECGFCTFMKAGPCGEVFSAWEKCVDDAEAKGENIVDKCMERTMALRECMTKNVEYYGVVLEAEREIGEEAEKVAVASKEDQDQGESSEAKELLDSFEEVLDVAKSVLESSEQRSKA